MLEAGKLAPAAANRQDWKSIVVRDHGLRKKLVTAAGGQRFLEEAPVVLIDCATELQFVMSCGQPAGMVDVTVAFAFMMPEATEHGPGACWPGICLPGICLPGICLPGICLPGAFDEVEVKKVAGHP